MAPVGPQIPSSTLEKRKRDQQEDGHHSGSGSESDFGPALPVHPHESAPKRPKVIGPSLPPSLGTDTTTGGSEKDSESSDDDEYGPSLPPTGAESVNVSNPTPAGMTQPTVSTSTVKRDDWMMVPPSGGDWTARVDPTKLKTRKFNTGKSAKGPASSDRGASDAWHETPQEKQARLQREMMGIRDAPATQASPAQASAERMDPETAKRLQEYNKSRGPSLYEARQKATTVEKDDDPSARAFDREKDIGGGLQINATQRRDLVKKATDFNSRFSSAKYL